MEKETKVWVAYLLNIGVPGVFTTRKRAENVMGNELKVFYPGFTFTIKRDTYVTQFVDDKPIPGEQVRGVVIERTLNHAPESLSASLSLLDIDHD